MRILFTRFPLESAFGGAEVQTLSLMEGLRERGHEVAFAGSCPTLLRQAAARGFAAQKLDIGPPPVTPWLAISFAWRQRRMRQQILPLLQGNWDSICLLSLSEKLLLTRTASQRGVHTLWIEHDRIGRWLTKNPWLKRLRRLSHLATTVCVSQLSRRLYLELGWPKQRVIAIPNGIDPARLGIQSVPVRETETLTVGCIARLTRDKGVDVLLAAMRNTAGIQLRIIGEGPEKPALTQQIQASGLEDRVEFAERTPTIGTFYKELDALVLPSREHDPFGLVAAEAMTLGLPVIVTDACGIADELTNGEDALIVPAGEVEALSTALASLSDVNLRLRLSEAAITTAKQRFSVGTMIDQYEEVLQNDT